jgi:hypothetical protein
LQYVTLSQKTDLFATEIVTTQAIDNSSLVQYELKGRSEYFLSVTVYACAYYAFCISIIDHDNQESAGKCKSIEQEIRQQHHG